MFYTIYRITNNKNNKIYIGKHQTKDINDNYWGSGKLLKRAIQKHGIENFSKEILFIFDNENDMNLKEQELVTEEFCDQLDNYNLCPGGGGGFGYINKNNLGNQKEHASLGAEALNLKLLNNEFRNDFKLKISKGIRNRINHDEHYKNHLSILAKSNQKIAVNASKNEVSRDKMKNSLKKINHQVGSKNSQFGTFWITNGEMNKKLMQKVEELTLYIIEMNKEIELQKDKIKCP